VGETINEIERELAAERVDLSRNLGELEMKARQMTDWRHYYRNHPGQLLGAALASGVVLGIIAGGKPGAAVSHHDYEPVADSHAPRLKSRALGRLEQDWQHISDALMGVASAKVMEFVANLVPGFKEQLHQNSRS